MSGPITWRNIGAPNFSGISLAPAAQMFKDAFSGLGSALNQENQTVQQNWDKVKENNTNTILNRLAEFQTPEEAQAALPGLREQLAGMGNQVDGVAARNALGSAVETLQRRATAANLFAESVQKHKDWQTAQADRPVTELLQAATLQADTPQGVENLKAAIRANQDLGQLSGQGALGLNKDVLSRGDVLTQRARELTKDGQEADKLKAQLAHWAAQDETSRMNANTSRISAEANAEAARAQAEYYRNGGSGGRGGAGRLTPEQMERQAAYEHNLKQTIYGDGDMTDTQVRKGIGETLKSSFGLTPNALEDVLEKLSPVIGDGMYEYTKRDEKGNTIRDDAGKPIMVRVPIPTRAVMQAVSDTSEVGNGSWWSRRGDKAASRLEQILKSPQFREEAAYGLEMRDTGSIRVLMANSDKDFVPGVKSKGK